MKTVSDMQDDIKDWADEIMPTRTAYNALQKLMMEEIPELAMSLRCGGNLAEGEVADVLILAFDIATLSGYDVLDIVERKMEINKRRKWEVDPATGLINHVGIKRHAPE